MILLIDADSLLYNSVWVCEKDDEAEVFDVFLNQVVAIQEQIEQSSFEIDGLRFYFTTCTNNFRLKICKEYKANRQENDVSLKVKELIPTVIDMLYVSGYLSFYSETLEADDLIAIDAKEISNSIVVSKDKDLKQIKGLHFDYQKIDKGNGFKEYKGLSCTDNTKSYDILMNMLLIGDVVDNIKGVHGIGEKKALKHLKGKTNFIKLLTVARLYNDFDRLKKNIKLIKL